MLAEVDGALERLRGDRPEIRVERDPPFVELPPIETPIDAPIVRAAQRAVVAAGLEPTRLGVPYATDAAMLTGIGGLPAVVLGPGDIAQAHTDDEWIELAQLDAAVQVYAGLCRAFAEEHERCA